MSLMLTGPSINIYCVTAHTLIFIEKCNLFLKCCKCVKIDMVHSWSYQKIEVSIGNKNFIHYFTGNE